ncbi:MAG: flagellar assembly protein FlbE [Caulobacterales bacterium]|nr:flagellar assembly protein FlbE [Caulobacterales bacterium]
MSDAAPQKFGFNTWFDDDGQVVSEAPMPRIKRAYLPAEVEVIRAEAFREGQADQQRRDESRLAEAVSQISTACAQALGGLDRLVARYQSEAATLAVATGEIIGNGALERYPQAPVAAALEAMAQELASASRLVVRVNAKDAGVQAAVEKAAGDAGFAGRVLVRDEPDLAPAAFVLEWPDGRAEYDPAEAAERVRDALAAALSAETDGDVDLLNGDQ